MALCKSVTVCRPPVAAASPTVFPWAMAANAGPSPRAGAAAAAAADDEDTTMMTLVVFMR